jgi:Rrf2 family protein
VNISAKTAYACLAIIELAADYGSGKPLQIGVIAERHGIPPRFLVQILLQLKGAGFVSSTRGASGGYQLIKDPADIALADVMSVIEGRTESGAPVTTNHSPTSRVLSSVWNEIQRAERTMLENTTIASLVERVRGETEQMYFI